VNIWYLHVGFEFKVKVPNLWEYLFLTCVVVAFLDHWTSKFSKWCTTGHGRGGTPFPHFSAEV